MDSKISKEEQGKYYVHPKALVETDKIGEDTRVWAFVHILNGAVIGSNCNIGDHSFIEDPQITQITQI